jgi:hypothetical protein
MNNQLLDNNGFYAERNSCKVWYNKNWLQEYEIDKLTDLKRELIYCKTVENYIRSFIEHLKDNVIRNFNNLSEVTICLGIFDKDNILHNFIIKIVNSLSHILKGKTLPNLYKSVFVVVEHENNIVFAGLVDFNGL